jgi:hypothetical protein
MYENYIIRLAYMLLQLQKKRLKAWDKTNTY